jgi:glycosyltransferase involved in cell wall biosynthesis
MKLLYDHQIFSSQRFGGVSKYFCEMIRNIPSEHSCKISLLFTENQYLKEGRNFFRKRVLPFHDKKFKGKGFLMNQVWNLNQSYSSRCIAANDFDLFHPTFYDDYFLRSLKKPYIITVHDMIRFKFKEIPDGDTIRQQMEDTIKKASRIIAVSENTKKDVIDILGIVPDKIDVVYHGFNRQDKAPGKNVLGKYVLFVGRRGFYKNFIPFITAISEVLCQEKDLKIVCTGEPFSKDEIEKLKELKIMDQAIQLPASEEVLNDLYANAQLFVYPSLYEGFGMPVLEAFANNCPVCLSDNSCFPEIAGNAGIYFDPFKKESILEAIKKVLYDNSLKSELISKGKERLAQFSWKKTAEETINAYKKIV